MGGLLFGSASELTKLQVLRRRFHRLQVYGQSKNSNQTFCFLWGAHKQFAKVKD